MKSSPRTKNVKTIPYMMITPHGMEVARYIVKSDAKPEPTSSWRPYYTDDYSNINPILKWYLKANLSTKDYKDFSLLSALISPDTTVLLTGMEEPYTFETLAEKLGFSVKKTKSLVQRFIKKGLVAIIPNPKYGKKGQVIKLYPYSLPVQLFDNTELRETSLPIGLIVY